MTYYRHINEDIRGIDQGWNSSGTPMSVDTMYYPHMHTMDKGGFHQIHMQADSPLVGIYPRIDLVDLCETKGMDCLGDIWKMFGALGRYAFIEILEYDEENNRYSVRLNLNSFLDDNGRNFERYCHIRSKNTDTENAHNACVTVEHWYDTEANLANEYDFGYWQRGLATDWSEPGETVLAVDTEYEVYANTGEGQLFHVILMANSPLVGVKVTFNGGSHILQMATAYRKNIESVYKEFERCGDFGFLQLVHYNEIDNKYMMIINPRELAGFDGKWSTSMNIAVKNWDESNTHRACVLYYARED
ncbi:hypothetical protein ACFLXE_00170 [Chloroflexota bacterium]